MCVAICACLVHTGFVTLSVLCLTHFCCVYNGYVSPAVSILSVSCWNGLSVASGVCEMACCCLWLVSMVNYLWWCLWLISVVILFLLMSVAHLHGDLFVVMSLARIYDDLFASPWWFISAHRYIECILHVSMLVLMSVAGIFGLPLQPVLCVCVCVYSSLLILLFLCAWYLVVLRHLLCFSQLSNSLQ